MGGPIDEQELRQRALAGVRHEVEAFGSAAPDSRLVRDDGLLAAIVPATPLRSVFNSVFYSYPAALAREHGTLATAYEAAGVRAWTVWVPAGDRASADLLAERGHVLDGVPRAMALDLAELGPGPPRPGGVEAAPVEPPAVAALNDRAYGFGGEEAFRAAFAGETAARWHGAWAAGEPVACAGTIDAGDDCCVTGVATLPEFQRRGIAGWLLRRALAEARERGMRTASLRASKAGAPAYERLGFLDLGCVEMWELRR
ncbi:MAG TPA: GNAT family N-acetyltransferase [Solirubrobacterales bacterium]|nr:GNAT family N-acetyltransferase [Solirubrobacterales bacterium]